MTLTITLNAEEEAIVRARADASGEPLDEFARAAVLNRAVSQAEPDDDLPLAPGESLADDLKGYIGVVDSKGQFNYSQDSGKHFTDILVEKKKQGRL